MVIGKVQLTANSESPIPEIERDSSWIPEAAKGKKRTTADFAPRKKRDFAPQAPESQQARGRGENRILIDLPDRIGGSGYRFGAREDGKVWAAHGRGGVPEGA